MKHFVRDPETGEVELLPPLPEKPGPRKFGGSRPKPKDGKPDPIKPPKDRNPTMTADEVLAEATRIARFGEGADKFRALRMVQSMAISQTVLPKPLHDKEVVERLSRLMAGYGIEATHRAYVKAFKDAKPKGWRARSREEGSVEDLAEGRAIHADILGKPEG